MAERTLNTRIKLRYDNYTNWQNSSVQLLAGEVAVCYVESNNSEIKNTAPTVLFKVGDGSHTFKDLKWASARAADVYDWAKAENKPGYNASEIVYGSNSNVEAALDDRYTKGQIDSKIQEIQGALEADTNTTYRFDTSVANKIVVYSKNIGSDAELKVCEFTVDFSALNNEISGIKGTLNQYGQTISSHGTRLDSLETDKADKTQLGNYYTKTESDNKFLTEHQSLAEYRKAADQDGIDAAQNAEIAKKLDKSEFNTEIAKYETVVNADLVRGRVTTLEGKVSNLTGAFTFQGQYNSFSELPAASSANKGHVYLIGDLEYVSDGSQWIQLGQGGEFVLKTVYNQHLTDQSNKDAAQDGRLDVLEGKVNNWKKLEITDPTPGDGKILVDGVEMNVYNDSALVGRVEVLEGAKHTHSNKSVLDGISAEKVSNWDNAEKNAKEYADGIVKIQKERIDEYAQIIAGHGTRLDNIEADYLDSSDKEEINNTITTKVEAERDRALGVEGQLSNRIKNVEDNYLSKDDVIIWNCGGAN